MVWGETGSPRLNGGCWCNASTRGRRGPVLSASLVGEFSTWRRTEARGDRTIHTIHKESLWRSLSAATSIATRHGLVLDTAGIFSTAGRSCFGVYSRHHNVHTGSVSTMHTRCNKIRKAVLKLTSLDGQTSPKWPSCKHSVQTIGS